MGGDDILLPCILNVAARFPELASIASWHHEVSEGHAVTFSGMRRLLGSFG